MCLCPGDQGLNYMHLRRSIIPRRLKQQRYGWIHGLLNPVNEKACVIRFTPAVLFDGHRMD